MDSFSAMSNTMQKWTQDQAIAFESARECIIHLIAICSSEIAALESRAGSDGGALMRRQEALAAELRKLHVHDVERVSWVRAEYGQLVRTSMVKIQVGTV